jgi:pimeloyl-ACP methyl ester carboxylesterase
MSDRRQIAAAEHLLALQRPWIPERQLAANDAELVADYLTEWAAPGRAPDEKALLTYRHAMLLSNTRHCSIEPFRWLMRSMGRPDGFQYSRRMRRPVRVPTLHLQGALDPLLLNRTAAGSGEYVEAPYRWRLLEGIGHYPQEEDPEGFSRELLNWLRDPEPDR